MLFAGRDWWEVRVEKKLASGLGPYARRRAQFF